MSNMISIIVPVYNGSAYLDKTINSLLSQPYKNIELILINDGSTDDSLNICKSYQNIDSRVVVVNKNNAGISAARNTGLEVAKGDYISFIDQDDEVESEIYNVLTSGLSDDVDMVISGKEMRLIDFNGELIRTEEFVYENKSLNDLEDIFKASYNCNGDMSLLHLWNCLYSLKVINDNGIRFNCSLKFGHEDSLFNIEYASKCKRINYVEGLVYHYYRRYKGSTSLKLNDRYLVDLDTYISCVCKAWNDIIIPHYNELNYTYFIRLGLSLWTQYSCVKRRRELYDVYQICEKWSNAHHLSINGVKNRYLYIFYSLVSVLIRLRMLLLASSILKVFKRKA